MLYAYNLNYCNNLEESAPNIKIYPLYGFSRGKSIEKSECNTIIGAGGGMIGYGVYSTYNDAHEFRFIKLDTDYNYEFRLISAEEDGECYLIRTKKISTKVRFIKTKLNGEELENKIIINDTCPGLFLLDCLTLKNLRNIFLLKI